MPRKPRRTRLRSSAPQFDILEMIVGGPFGLDDATNDAVEKELAKSPAILESWRRQRAITSLPDDALIAASEQTHDPEVAKIAGIELRVRISNLKLEKLKP